MLHFTGSLVNAYAAVKEHTISMSIWLCRNYCCYYSRQVKHFPIGINSWVLQADGLNPGSASCGESTAIKITLEWDEAADNNK